MPPGLPGRTPYNVTNHKAFQTDPAKAKSLLKSANAMGYEIKFLFRTDDPISVKGKDAIVKSLTESGFKATPVPTTTAELPRPRATTPRKTSTSAPPAGAPTGRRVRPGCRPLLRFDQPGQDQLVRARTTPRSATSPWTRR